MTKKIIGAGGGGGGKGGGQQQGRVAVEASDSLRSIAYARVLDLISEGEIEGLVDGAKSIYLDETPLQNPDGTYNFTGTAWTTRTGTQAQPYITGFPAVENTTALGIEVKYGIPITRQYSNPNLDSVRVTLAVPALSSQNKTNGDLSGTSVEIQIYVQSNGGGFVLQDLSGRGVISGKTSSRYQRSYAIPLEGSAPWDVRVVRLTADAATAALNNRTYWDSTTEIIEAKLRYPNSALVGLSCDASQFSNIPSRAYDVKLLKVRVPSNYNPVTRAYTGSWDGTFQVAWTDNPAWCFYDLVTTARYGLGEFIDPSQVDKWSLYTIGRYCDELVPDGFGGQEPRFTCNLWLQTRAEAYRVINDFASIFRGMVFWSSGTITAIQDAPATPAYLYTAANVIDGVFGYTGSSAKARHTVGLVTWNDMADFGRQKVEYVEDTAGIARYGVITTEVAAVGCTSRGQANRVGRWILFSERTETETVTFKTGIEGMIARPGQVIKVADPNRAGVRMGGRLLAASAGSVTLDAPVTLVNGQAYTLSVLKADGTVQDGSVSHSGGTLSALTLSPALAEAPVAGSVWILTSASVEPQTFRVVAVIENDKHEFEITALAHDPDKFAAVESNLVLEPRSISVLSGVLASPTGLLVSESLYVAAQGVRVRMTASWEPVDGATGYGVTYKLLGGNSSPEIITQTPSVDIPDVVDGFYTVTVVAINPIGVRSRVPAVAQYQVVGKTAPPENVTGFVVARNDSVLNFTWRHVSDIDLDHYEIRQGTSWNTGIAVGATVANMLSFSAPRGGPFMIKAVDTSGNFSDTEAVVVASDISGINIVLASDEDANGWAGARVDTIVMGDGSGVILNGGAAWDTYTGTWNSYVVPWVHLDVPADGSYDTEAIDIGFVATSTVSIESVVEAITNQPPWDAFTDPWATYAAPDWTWQGIVSGLGASYEIVTSADGVTWAAWQTFTPGAYTFRFVKIRVNMSTTDASAIPFLSALVVRVDVPDRVIHFEDVAVPIAGVTLSFTPVFVGVQTVQVTLQSAISGDRFTVTGKSNSQVTVQCFDSAGAAKAGLVDVDVFGYGERY